MGMIFDVLVKVFCRREIIRLERSKKLNFLFSKKVIQNRTKLEGAKGKKIRYKL